MKLVHGCRYTNKDIYGHALEILDYDEAQEFFSEVIQYLMESSPEKDQKELEYAIRNNILVYALCFDQATIERSEQFYLGGNSNDEGCAILSSVQEEDS